MRAYGILFCLLCLTATNALAGFPPGSGLSSLLKVGRVGASSKILEKFLPSSVAKRSVTPPLNNHLTPHAALTQSMQLLSNVSLQLSRLSAPSIRPLEENIQRFVFTVSPLENPTMVAGSGFVFARRLNEITQLWGATTASIAQQTGSNVLLMFHLSPDSAVSFPGKIVLQGSEQGSNVALISVPQDITRIALPVALNTTTISDSKRTALVYGFHSDGNLYKIGTAPIKQTSERILAHSPQQALNLSMQGGLVIDAQGHALGLYNKSYSSNGKFKEWILPNKRKFFANELENVGEFIPMKHLEYLLREYETPHSAARVILFGGRVIGKMELNESVMGMEVFYDNATPAVLEKNPFWSLYDLDTFIPYRDHATKVHIHIAGADGEYAYSYVINCETGHSVRLENLLVEY